MHDSLELLLRYRMPFSGGGEELRVRENVQSQSFGNVVADLGTMTVGLTE
jgi:hypothetical protein